MEPGISDTPRASIIIPAYNGADSLGEAIQSVLDQTYPHLELIVVDDASKDETGLVVKSFDDPRVIYIAHSVNRGACGARKTGVQSSTGEVIFFLDQDDLFHSEKVARHIAYHDMYPDIGLTYNAFLNLNPSSAAIRDVTNPASPMTLADLVLGFPLPPSGWVLKRPWAERQEVFDEFAALHGGEYVTCGRLYLAGCRFEKVDGALHTRRYQAGRVFHNLRAKCEAELACQEIIFSDPRCPDTVLAIRDTALSKTYRSWAYLALKQEETSLGRELLREAVRLQPEMLSGVPSGLTLYLLTSSLSDERVDHARLLQSLYRQLPEEMEHLCIQYDWSVRQGHLLKGVQAVMWNRPDDARRYFKEVQQASAQLDEATSAIITARLMDYAQSFGFAAANKVFDDLWPYIVTLPGTFSARKLKGLFAFNRALHQYRLSQYDTVPNDLFSAMRNQPRFLVNRGTYSMLLRSTAGRLPGVKPRISRSPDQSL